VSKFLTNLFGKIFFACIHIVHAVLVTKIIYRDKSEFKEERKISKFYRALVSGILDNDEVTSPSPYLFLYTFLIS
jgi:hypothetical protein